MDKKLAKYFNSLKEESEAARRGSPAEISDTIEDISTLTSELIDEADISFAVAAVFDEDSGILSAVETLLPSRDRAAVKAKDNCLTFLAQFISRIGKRALAYAPFVKAKCMGIFRREDSRSVQAAALTPLLSILESSMQESIPPDFLLDWTWAESLLIEYRKARTAGTLKSNILILIGYAVEKFPALFQEEHLDIILKICLDTLEEELHRTGNNPVFVLVTGAIRCLDSLLLWFDRTVPAGGSVENSRKIYAYIEQVLHFREDLKRYEMVKAGLRLFSRHACLFRLRLLENSMVILKWLQSYCTHGNSQLRDAAFPAFEQFISEIVSCIISDDQRAKNSHQTYKKIFSDALGVLDSPGSDPKLTSLAILTVGKLSPLILKFSGKGSLLQTFYRLVPFGGSPRRDTNGREESLNFSVTLVGAFANMVVYLDEIENYTVSLIAKAVGNTFHGFPYMFTKQRYGLYASLQRLFKALYSRDAVFTVFLNNIVWSSLERAMGQDDGRELGAPLWKHYVELWSQLLMLFRTARKGHGINDIDKENIAFSEPSETSYGNIKDADLQASIFDCLLKSIMKAMVELNLKYRVKSSQVHELSNAAREQDLATDALGNEGEGELIEPLDPLQMRKFLNLVEFVQEFLSCDFVNLFLKWVYPFGRFLVELSSQYPLISGFYKLLAISIHKAEERAYFGELESLSIMKITRKENEIENPLAEDSMFGESVSQQHRDLCKTLFRKYLQEVLVASKRYKLELFASCLHLCLSAPPPVMDIESLVAPTISALKIGLRYFPLAMVAINSLENWHHLHPEKLEPWLPHIIPYFNPYLVQSDSREVSTSTDSREVTTSTNSRSTSGASRFSSSRIYRKNARVTETHATQIQVGSFEHIQLRVQKFLGKIGGQSHLLVPDINLLQVTGVGGLAWDTRNQVRFNLPFRDIKPDIWLDSLLLRIVELSTSATERQAKIVASELLHAICLVMLGNAAKGPVRRKDQEHQSVAETRFASHTIVLRRLVRVKEALCQMVISNKWGGWKQVDTEKAKIVKDLIFSDDFWNRVEYALELTEPLMSMLRYADTDEPCLGNIYDAMDSMLERMKSVIQRREQDPDTLYSTVEKIVLHRWNKMTTPLHLLAYALSPRYYSSEILDIPGRVPPYRDPEVAAGYKRALNRLFSDPDVASNVRREFVDFVSGKFAEPDAINDQSRMDAIGWWYLHGERYMYLQPLAIKILSQVHYEKIYRRLFPAILRLATDMELVTRQLFSVFVKQLIHWFTSNTQKENPDSMALLDSILDGVVDADNGSLREFCADCFAEFMRWSVRHVSAEVDNFVNIASMLHRLYTRLDHPNAYHRLGAAMACHLIYPVLRENAAIVDCHILEMLFFCIKSLQVGENDNDQIGTMKQMGKVLEGIQRLIRRNISILLKNRKDRRMFLNIEDFLDWLFLQTGRSEEKCRKKCMWLFNSLSDILPVGSSANWFKSKVKNVQEIQNILRFLDTELRLPDLNSDKCTADMLEIWMKKLMCCLQWFEWALKGQLVSLYDIVLDTGEEIFGIGAAINDFLQSSFWDTYHNLLEPLTPFQKECHGCLRVNTILELLKLLEVMLYVEHGIKEQDVEIPQERMKTLVKEAGRIHQVVPFSEPHFQNLIFDVLFHPPKISYSLLESQSLEDLVRQTMKIIKMLSFASSVFKESFIHFFRSLISEGKIKLDINFLSFSEHTDLVNIMYILKGYQQLHQVGLLLPALGKENTKRTGQKLLNSLLSLQQPCPPALQPVALEVLTLAIALGVTVSQLLELVLDHKRLGQSGSMKSAENIAGSQFYFNFRNVIVQQIKFSYKECLSVLLQEAVKNFTARLILIAVLDDYLKKESITKSSFLREYLKHVQLLSPCCHPEATLSDKLFFLEMLHKLFMLDTSCDTVLEENQPSFYFIIESYFLLFNSGQLVPELGATKLLHRNTVMTVKSNALVIAPFFLKYAINNKILLRLVDTITKVVADHLLVRETDIPQGSNERVAYIDMLQKLEDAILMANRLELLEVIFPLFQSHVKLTRKKAQEILESYAEIVDENRGLACDHCLKMLNDCDKVASLRRAVFDYMFVAMINRAPAEFIVGWYEHNIIEFKQILDKCQDKIQSTLETEQDYLVVRICHYKMVELLFNRVDAKTIKDRITPIVSNQLLMQHATSDSRGKNDPATFPFPENIILWRELHIAAYNCLAEIVMRTQDQEKLYAVLFKDFPGKPLWQNIVDCSKVYNSFPVETSTLKTSYLAVKSLRSERRNTKQSSGVSSLSSQYIVGATLTDEPALINTFVNDSQKRTGGEVNVDVKDDDSGQAVAGSFQVNDLNTDQDNEEEVVEKEEIDHDDFDRHLSMGIILRLIEHCQQKFSVKSSNDGMPEWMKSLYATLANVVTPINVCLFIAKIISKARKVLAPFASTWFRPYVQVILRDPDHSGGRTFHYMLRDICITILEWNLPFPPDVPVASSFVNHLISVAAHTSKLVLQANLEVIRLYIQTWKDSISLDRCAVIHYLTTGGGNPNMNDKAVGMKRSVGLQLLGIMVASDISLCGLSDNFRVSEEDLCKALLLNVRYKLRNVYNAAAELIGMVLKHTEEGKLSIKEHMLQSPLKQILLSLFKDADAGQFLNIIDKITIHFPPFLDSYVAMVLDLLPRIHGVFRVTALDILLRRSNSIPNLFNSIAPFLSKLLTHRDKIAQLKSLQLVSELVKDLPNSKIIEKVLPVLYEAFNDHEDSDCRQLYFNILIFLYKEKEMDKNELLHHHLLLGLSDDSDAVKHNLQSFWHSELSHDLCPRLVQMVNDIYDGDVEDRWSQITVNLLLKLCEESVDFERPVFNAPLSDCEFHEYTINTSWLGGTLPLTPLFSETQTQLTSLSSLDNTIQDSVTVDTKGKARTQNKIRATYVPSQSLSLSQTQSSMTGDVQVGSSLFALSKREGNSNVDSSQHGRETLIDKGTTLKRRILQSSLANSQAKINAINAARRRQSQLMQQSLERANKVQMMRKYRIGELPDIEIAYKDVIIPLSVLAEKDNVFSRLFLVVFCHSMYSLHPDDLHKAEHELKHTVRDGIEAALKRTRNGASFVGCAMDICLETKESWIQPKIIGSASQKSRNFHTGVLLLENAILHETPADYVHKASKKRHCGPTRKVRKENFVFEAWLELVKLYESIGEHDVVLSIYKTSLTKAVITGRALESQLYGDSNKALQLYDNAINQFEGANTSEGIEITSVEQDLWYNQRLQCLVDLNRWQDIMEDTLLQINKEASEEPDFQTLWSPGVQDPYLRLFIKGSLKLPTYSSLLSDFVQDALDNAAKRELLYCEFSVELATLAVLNDQFDLAKFYIQKGFDSFINHWSSNHPLATVSRHLLVRKLQRIVEVDEFVEMIPITSERVQLQSLLPLWRNRWPTAKFDDVEAWDDIVQNRLLYIQKSQDLVRKCGDNENSTRLLAVDLGSEQACIFFQAARGLMRQGSYDAAQGYMNQYMAVIEGSTKTEKLDFKIFKALVKLRCLQADRESTVNSCEAIKMLQQVRSYVTTTAEKQKYQTQTQWQTGLKLLKGDVTSQLAQVSLKVLAVDHTSSRAVENCISLLSSAYMAYSGLLGEVASNGHSEKDNLFSPKRLAKVFLKFAFFCDELLTSTKDGQWGSQIQSRIKEGNPVTGLPHSSVYPSVIVKYIMKAVQLDNSMQVQHGIARVLTMLGHYKETHSEFRAQIKGTPCWLFIAWIPQMLAVLDRDEGEILVGLLEEIARYYPQALYFPFNVSRSDFGTLGQERAKRLEILLNNPIMKGFTRALEDLTFPEQRLRNGLTLLKSLLSVGDKKGAQRAFNDIFEDCLDVTFMMDDNRKSGEYNLKFARDYSKRILKALGENGGKLKSMDEGQFTKALNDVMINLTKSQKNLQVGKMSLSSLSKWMADFDGSYSLVYDKEEHGKALIEIPGIYSSFKKPEPSSHVKLLSFDQTLQSLSSKQRPKILKMRGSDEQDYKFVVKGGEDLRLDQRIEQLFDVMNTVLLRDSSCARRKLSLRTYAVIPISKQCGIMQFVEGTTILEDVIKDGLMDRLPCAGQQASRQGRNTPKDLLLHLRSQYHEWIDKKGASKDVSECYRNMYRNVGADEVIQKMNSLISQLPWDALKIGISRLATSAESFLALRSEFVRSLSVVSICGYIAGIGDRHLSNFLMDTTNGMLVPIDFGYSFGTGVILLPVPELIPFRLTSQLINLLLPLDSIGLLRNDMVRTLSALHANRKIISAVLDIFVNEPLVDWKNEAMKTAALQQTEFSGSGSESQPRQVSSHERKHVALKVENAHRKLNFWNPADITISELHSSVHSNKRYLSDLKKLVRGNPEHNVRARIQRTVCESIQEQVDCLIDQATDLNLLGRIWVGWQPWL